MTLGEGCAFLGGLFYNQRMTPGPHEGRGFRFEVAYRRGNDIRTDGHM